MTSTAANHCHITPSPLPPLVLTTTHDNGCTMTMEKGGWQWCDIAVMWAKQHQQQPHTMRSTTANHCHITPSPSAFFGIDNNTWQLPHDDNEDRQTRMTQCGPDNRWRQWPQTTTMTMDNRGQCKEYEIGNDGQQGCTSGPTTPFYPSLTLM